MQKQKGFYTNTDMDLNADILLLQQALKRSLPSKAYLKKKLPYRRLQTKVENWLKASEELLSLSRKLEESYYTLKEKESAKL